MVVELNSSSNLFKIFLRNLTSAAKQRRKKLSPVFPNAAPGAKPTWVFLIRDAYLDANPNNPELKEWFDITLKKFDDIYGDTRPGFIQGYKLLKENITPG